MNASGIGVGDSLWLVETSLLQDLDPYSVQLSPVVVPICVVFERIALSRVITHLQSFFNTFGGVFNRPTLEIKLWTELNESQFHF